jgi:selenide,water dikinase
VHAATDVTGFGLLGHLRNMTAASRVEAEVVLADVPVLDRAVAYVEAGIAPGGTHANARFLADWVEWGPGIEKPAQLLLCDAQTSGGLLLAVAERDADTLLAALKAAGTPAAHAIGRVTGQGTGRIRARG